MTMPPACGGNCHECATRAKRREDFWTAVGGLVLGLALAYLVSNWLGIW